MKTLTNEYKSPMTEVIEMNAEGIICQSDIKVDNPFVPGGGSGDDIEEQW